MTRYIPVQVREEHYTLESIERLRAHQDLTGVRSTCTPLRPSRVEYLTEWQADVEEDHPVRLARSHRARRRTAAMS